MIEREETLETEDAVKPNETLATQSLADTDLADFDRLADEDIAKVMNLDKLQQVLDNADAFLLVNSDKLDEF